MHIIDRLGAGLAYCLLWPVVWPLVWLAVNGGGACWLIAKAIEFMRPKQ